MSSTVKTRIHEKETGKIEERVQIKIKHPMWHNSPVQIISNVKWINRHETEEPNYVGCVIFMNRDRINFNFLPKREATVEERRQMLGCLSLIYEMKLPILYCAELRKFYLMNYYDPTIVIIDREVQLEVLQTTKVLPCVFRKVKRKPRQIWR